MIPTPHIGYIILAKQAANVSNYRYFGECNGLPVRLDNVGERKVGPDQYAFTGLCPCGQYHPMVRKVIRTSMPSNHECDARCMNATGRVMNCQCSCGGKNHGRGTSLRCEAA